MALLTTETAAAQLFGTAHTQRMLALLPSFEVDDEYADEVVKLCVDTLQGRAKAPILDEHALEEVGCCTDCDAAILLQQMDIEILRAA